MKAVEKHQNEQSEAWLAEQSASGEPGPSSSSNADVIREEAAKMDALGVPRAGLEVLDKRLNSGSKDREREHDEVPEVAVLLGDAGDAKTLGSTEAVTALTTTPLQRAREMRV